MKSSHDNSSFTAKKKSLSININSDHIGPHGMPLVHGSTPDRIGILSGTVRFSSTYDCKGRDLTIIYEAWRETNTTTIENKKVVHHRSKKVFGHQSWSVPLIHTKPNGNTIVAGVYEQKFEVAFTPPTYSTRQSIDSSYSSSSASSSSTSLSSTSSIPTQMTLLPSSNLSPHEKVKYTITAILHRPFPSLSHYEASQEIWVVHSSVPSTPSRSSSLPSKPISPPETHCLKRDGMIKKPYAASMPPSSRTSIAFSAPKKADIVSARLSLRKPSAVSSNSKQFLVYFSYFCTMVIGLAICKRYCFQGSIAQ